MAKAPKKDKAELGVSGLTQYSGFVSEEFLPQLQGVKGVKVFRAMTDNDPIIGAVLSAIGLILRAVKWDAAASEENKENPEAEELRVFALSLLDDMSHSFEDFISEAITMLSFGWAWHELVIKNRVGPDESDPTKRSRHTDGRIGIRKLAPRAQESLDRWEFDEDGGIRGMWQRPPNGMVGRGDVFLPIERGLLFRTTSRKNNPEGVSVLRNAYRPYFFAQRIEEHEAIGVERDLVGIPIVRIPLEYLAPDASDAHRAVRAKYEKIALDLGRNEQAGLVLPSDPYVDDMGKPTGLHRVGVELLGSPGSKMMDTDKIIVRHQRNIARSVLADFIMLGTDGKSGSYALSQNKSDLFMRACETYLNQIAAVLNRHMLPRIWALNGLDPEMMPKYKPGALAPVDIEQLGQFLQTAAGAGMELFPDPELDTHLREEVGLPPKSEEAQALQDERREEDMQVAADAAKKVVKAYNPSQPRDEMGRWSDDDGVRSVVVSDEATGTVARLVDQEERGMLVTALETWPTHRGKGGAERVMQRITAYLDGKQLRSRLNALATDEATDVNRLRAFYSRHGYKARGPVEMVREPRRPNPNT